jgi:hypothetical protein
MVVFQLLLEQQLLHLLVVAEVVLDHLLMVDQVVQVVEQEVKQEAQVRVIHLQ